MVQCLFGLTTVIFFKHHQHEHERLAGAAKFQAAGASCLSMVLPEQNLSSSAIATSAVNLLRRPTGARQPPPQGQGFVSALHLCDHLVKLLVGDGAGHFGEEHQKLLLVDEVLVAGPEVLEEAFEVLECQRLAPVLAGIGLKHAQRDLAGALLQWAALTG